MKLLHAPRTRRRSGQAGFTLIELMVVIAILAILLTLLGTVVVPAWKKSRCTSALASLKTAVGEALSALDEVRTRGKPLDPALVKVKGVCTEFKALKDSGCYEKDKNTALDTALTALAAEAATLRLELQPADQTKLDLATADCR